MENGTSRLEQTTKEVDEVKVIMQDNLNKAGERAGKLDELKNQANVLLEQSKGFEKTTKKLMEQKKGGNKKMRVVFIIVGVAAFLIIVGLIVFAIMQPSQ